MLSCLAFVAGMFHVMYFTTPHKVGDSVISLKNVIPIGFQIIPVGEENIYLFDELKNCVFIYQKDGSLVGIYNFNNGGGFEFAEADEDKDVFIVINSRKATSVSFNGEILSIEKYESGALEAKTSWNAFNYDNEYNSFKVNNYFFFYSVYNNDELLFRKASLLPLVIFGLLTYFGGLIYFMKNSYGGEDSVNKNEERVKRFKKRFKRSKNKTNDNDNREIDYWDL